MGRPTIYDVAEAAGVAPSTVSRAFSDPLRLSEHTRHRVLDTAAALGYRSRRRRAPAGRSRTIAMVVSDITNPHYFELVRGAELGAKAAGYTLVLVNAEETPRVEYDQIQQLSRSVDGFVLAASRLPDENLVQIAAVRGVVLLNRELAGAPSASLDHADGCRQIVEHLASLGHRELVYLSGPPTSWMASHRWTELRRTADQLGLTLHRAGPFVPRASHGAAAADAALTTSASAIVAHNDLLAIGVLQRLVQRGLRVPADVSVVGFDDIFAAELCHPTLTTLGGSHVDVGRAGVQILLDELDGGTDHDKSRLPRRAVIPSELRIRASTG
ncbi:LacI family DNA-binding transcriptional regulator [Mumia sp. Pv 4-285]|uniref:LacI family DNA-binding transcriptional regulator n=1 Tax=Mumia qirimensis TaxID=3234852 RepID=UPI00351D8BB8